MHRCSSPGAAKGYPGYLHPANILLLWADRPAYPLTMDFPRRSFRREAHTGTDPQDPLQEALHENGAALWISMISRLSLSRHTEKTPCRA